MAGALPPGSPRCRFHRRSPQGAHSGVRPGHLQGDGEDVKTDKSKVPAIQEAWTWQLSLSSDAWANRPKADLTSIFPPFPSYLQMTRDRGPFC